DEKNTITCGASLDGLRPCNCWRHCLVGAGPAGCVGGRTVGPTRGRRGGRTTDGANDTGADRVQKIIAGAKKEGSVSVYTSLQTADIGKLGAAFEKKYGVKVSPWRSGSEAIVNRTIQEARANRFTVDVLETNGPELESIHREKLLQAMKSR